MTTAVAILFAAPLILLGFAAAHEMRLIFPKMMEARHSGIALPDFINEIPVIGAAIADWWSANLADPQMAQAMLGMSIPASSPNRRAILASKSSTAL